jgi:putative transposase
MLTWPPGSWPAAYNSCERLQHIWADIAYCGQRLRTWVEDEIGWTLEIVERPRRWVVERTIAWIGRYRGLSKEYEYLLESSETMLYLTMSRLMLRHLPRQAPYGVPSPQREGLRGLARAF